MTHNIYDEALRDGLRSEAERVAAAVLETIKRGRKTLVDGSKVPLGMKLVRDDDEEAKLCAAQSRCGHAIPNLELCPACWFEHGVEAEIVPTGQASGEREAYRCAAHCGWSADIDLAQTR